MPKWMVEQAKGIEPSFPAWKAGVLAVIRCPHNGFCTLVSYRRYIPGNFFILDMFLLQNLFFE